MEHSTYSPLATSSLLFRISQLSLPNWTKLTIGALIFLTTYTTTAPLIGAVNKTDIQNLREMLNELGPLSYLFKLPLNIIEKLTTIFQF